MHGPETPVTNHSEMPGGVPLVADFHDDRNRLSYHYPLINHLPSINTPTTKFFTVSGFPNAIPTFDYDQIAEFMQSLTGTKAFVRGDFSSAKLSQEGRHINNNTTEEIKQTIGELIKNLVVTEKQLGGRIAVREHIPHDIKLRYFIRDGTYEYHEQLNGGNIREAPVSKPRAHAKEIANEITRFAWSVDFILHKETKQWYCIDMGLDGLYYETATNSWKSISEHPDESQSPEIHATEMPHPNTFNTNTDMNKTLTTIGTNE